MDIRSHTKLWAILHLRCPRCHHGRVYAGFVMNRCCAVCRLKFEREPGYFSGAACFSYLILPMIVVLWLVVLYTLFPQWSDLAVHGLSLALMLPFIPYVIRYSRVLWMTMDRAIDVSP